MYSRSLLLALRGMAAALAALTVLAAAVLLAASVPASASDNNPGGTIKIHYPPTPVQNSAVAGTVTIEGEASNSQGIYGLTIYESDGKTVICEKPYPAVPNKIDFSYEFDTSVYEDGPNFVKVVVSCGGIGDRWVEIHWNIQNNMPTIRWSSPEAGATVNSCAVRATATDTKGEGITRVRLSVDGRVVKDRTYDPAPVTASFSYTFAADFGEHLLTLDAWNVSAKTSGSDRTVYGTSGAKSSFYFAEGYTGDGFQEYLCFGNPTDTEAEVVVTYMFPDGEVENDSYLVPEQSRNTIDVNGEVGADKEVSARVLSSVSEMVAERPMYFNYEGKWTGGSDAMGAGAPAKDWYFAEGTTRAAFDEYVTVLNPGGETAELFFRYMVEGEGEKVVPGEVPANSRATFSVAAQVGLEKDVSLLLQSDRDVVAERPMYFDYMGLAAHHWTGGHVVMGANAPSKQWYFAEGTTRSGFEEWLCLQNPGTSKIKVDATYMLGKGQGGTVRKSYQVPPKERLTVSVNEELGPQKDASVSLSSKGAFIAERPMYFDYAGRASHSWTGGHDVMGALGPAVNWFFAEGYTGDNFEEWLCLQNPGDKPATARVTYFPEEGPTIERTHNIPANSRYTIDVNSDAGPDLSISARVESTRPLIAERAMYFNFNAVWTGGHDVVGHTPPAD